MGTNSSSGVDRKLDHCNVSEPTTYNVLSGVVVGQFVLGLPLNLSVLYIFIFRFKFWKNKSVFLFNIVVADFLLVTCLPAKAHSYQLGQRRSPNYRMCKAMLFMLFLNRGASIAFLVVLSLDRYFNVVHLGQRNIVKVMPLVGGDSLRLPPSFNFCGFVDTLKKSPQISAVIWMFLLLLAVPTMLETFECCNSLGRAVETFYHDVADVFREVVFFSEILVPFVILLYCTLRIVRRLKRKTVGDKAKLRRATCVVVSVAVIFAICFLPCALARAALLYVRLQEWDEAEEVAVQVYDALMVLSYTDCLLDPMVYCFCHRGFKDAYVDAFCPAFLHKRLRKAETTTATAAAAASAGRSLSLPMIEKIQV
ncbi:12-(S)-hydroxy-5,8,10,14-eicosatetraenoic acid receptor-like isoform X1 [Syngnathoides biaculeatus]|uniref:12-(S)-hydroxy-5,8,10,14-eicosatetraenoic acid receptor-like isoform X1 n=1 Tax=Syngnathoides biaculeatus TaxID=300417 RepID=UPI002ADD88F0|nr:12-(S)-hydroxy-5,8,10,14-eicosatetraenoic acid receptor-like isoform X1 [Syngnathoides biaculeatus]